MKPINIVTAEFDSSSNSIIEYILYLGGTVNRINEETGISGISIAINNNDTKVNTLYDSKEVPIYANFNLYRRGSLIFKQLLDIKLKNLSDFEGFYEKELSLLNSFYFKSSKFIGSYIEEVENNKLYNLLIAKQLGINVPNTLVTTSKKEAVAFFNQHKKLITKPIHNGHISFTTAESRISSTGTRLVTLPDLLDLDEKFAPMLLQVYIEKQVEVRSFYFDNKFYSGAIFSQNDSQTALDYRNYNRSKPNRLVPFKLPKSIETKLKKLLKITNNNTASIDIILNVKNEFVFLEFNPAGQYGWVSDSCNYNLDEVIAKALIKKSFDNEIS